MDRFLYDCDLRHERVKASYETLSNHFLTSVSYPAKILRDDFREIFFKTVCGISLIFCRSRFMNNFVVNSNFLEPWNHQKLNIWRPIYFENFPHTGLKILSIQISWKDFFLKKAFHWLGVFSTPAKPLIWASFFSTKN